MSGTKLVYMCPICRNRIEYVIDSITMYTHGTKMVKGELEEIEIEQPITTAAMVTTINPIVCNHLKCTDKKIKPMKMIPVPEWVPSLMDKLIEIFPDMYGIRLPTFQIWGDSGEDSTCSLHLSFNTSMTEFAVRFMEIANIALAKDIYGYRSNQRFSLYHNKFDIQDEGVIKRRNTVRISAPSVNFMKSNKGDALAFCSFIEYIIHQFKNYDQLTIGGI